MGTIKCGLESPFQTTSNYLGFPPSPEVPLSFSTNWESPGENFSGSYSCRKPTDCKMGTKRFEQLLDFQLASRVIRRLPQKRIDLIYTKTVYTKDVKVCASWWLMFANFFIANMLSELRFNKLHVTRLDCLLPSW